MLSHICDESGLLIGSLIGGRLFHVYVPARSFEYTYIFHFKDNANMYVLALRPLFFLLSL